MIGSVRLHQFPTKDSNFGGILRRTAIPSIATRGSDVRDPEFPERMGLTALSYSSRAERSVSGWLIQTQISR